LSQTRLGLELYLRILNNTIFKMAAYSHYIFKDSLHGEYSVWLCHNENIKTSNWIVKPFPHERMFEIHLNTCWGSPCERDCNKIVKKWLDKALKAKKDQ
jgi:hypothetical protein